jgi:hypothetical protein
MAAAVSVVSPAAEASLAAGSAAAAEEDGKRKRADFVFTNARVFDI